MTPRADKHQTGFTIIELLIATLVFSVLLIVMMSAIIRTSDLFYKGVSMSKTQEDARNVVQSIASDIQFTGGAPIAKTGVSTSVFCIGIHRYQYVLRAHVNGGSNYGIQRDDQGRSNCNPDTLCDTTTCVNMLDNNMQLNDLTIDCTKGPYCDVHIHVVFYGGSSTGLFTPSPTDTNAQCTGSLSDSKICATVDYDSTVLEKQ